MWSPYTGGLLFKGHWTGNNLHWSWLMWSPGTGGCLIKVVALIGFAILPALAVIALCSFLCWQSELFDNLGVFLVATSYPINTLNPSF